MSAVFQAFATLCFLLVVKGDVVTLRLPHITRDSQGQCHLPDVINIEVLRHGQEDGLELELSRKDVLPTQKMVYVMSQDQHGVTRVDQVELQNDEHDVMQSYHDHEHGAAFTVRCTPQSLRGQFYVLEGSVYFGGQKFRLSPSARWQQEAEIMSSHVTVTYVLTEIQDVKPGDSAVIAATSHELRRKARETTKDNLHHRYKRQSSTSTETYYIDILAVVDFKLIQKWEELTKQYDPTKVQSDINKYLANTFTSAALRIETLVIGGRKLKIRMIPPLFLNASAAAPYDVPTGTSVQLDATKALFNFSDWLVAQSSRLPEHDHAMLFTAYDLFGGSDQGIRFNITKGLAFLGGMCHVGVGQSCSVIEDKGAYQSEGVVTHELGHSLGARHDGDGNTCKSSDRYLMADTTYQETDATKLNPWSFSPCSSEAIWKELEELEKNATYLQQCLRKAIGAVVQNFTTINPNDQCKTFYGNASFLCRGTGLPTLSEVCDEFYCRLPGTTRCERMVAATGTCCGNQMKCNAGKCESAGSGECPIANEACPFGDQPGVVVDGLTCAQLKSTYCYQEDIRAKCCDTCAKQKRNESVCLYGDKQLGCAQDQCGSIIPSGQYANFAYDYVCCETCKVQCLDRGTISFNNGQKKECKALIVDDKMEFFCNVPSIQSDTCCKTCDQVHDPNNSECPWADRTDSSACSSLYNTAVGTNCTDVQRQQCCRTCALIEKRTTTTTTTTTTTKPTTTTTKSTTTTTTKSTTTTTIKPPSGPGGSQTTSDGGGNSATKITNTNPDTKDSGAKSSSSDSELVLPLAVGISVGVFVLIVIIGISVYCYRRNAHAHGSKQQLVAQQQRPSGKQQPAKQQRPSSKQRPASEQRPSKQQRTSKEQRPPRYDDIDETRRHHKKTEKEAPTDLRNGRHPYQPSTDLRNGRQSYQPPTDLRNGRQSYQPSTDLRNGRQSYQPPTDLRNGRQSYQPSTDLRNGRQSYQPSTDLRNGRYPPPMNPNTRWNQWN